MITLRTADAELNAAANGKALQVAMLLGVAAIFGGGGSGAGLFNLIVQLASLALIAFNRPSLIYFFRKAPRILTLLVGATILLPILQCIPLPPLIWQVLPGRNLVIQSFDLLGSSDVWFPMSLNVRRTLVAFLSLMPPFAILILSWNLPEKEKNRLLVYMVITGVLIVLLGAQQLVTGNRQFQLFAETYRSQDLHGTFANRNSAGIFLDITLCGLISISSNKRFRSAWRFGSVAIGMLLVVGLILSRSRSSMLLVSIPLVYLVFRIFSSQISFRRTRRAFVAAALGFGLLIGGIIIIGKDNQRIQGSLSRFSRMSDARPLIWQDSVESIARFWPLGSGIGTFDEVFQIDETLENIGPGRAARAHNEYIEVAIESGLLGLTLLASWLIFLFMSGLKAARRGGTAIAPIPIFIMLALQSILDYPLRNETLLCVSGLMLALLVDSPYRRRSSVSGSDRQCDLGTGSA